MTGLNPILEKIKGGLIVSCQALEGEPLHGPIFMKKMALAAFQGGAVGIRANGPADIYEIKKEVSLPVIGLYKKNYPDSDVFITPTLREVHEIVEAGADIIAFDATLRKRPFGKTLEQFYCEIKEQFSDILLMADVSTFAEGLNAYRLGVDLISTTLSGYTPYTAHIQSFDEELLVQLVKNVDCPVIAEGRVDTPELAAKCLRLGAYSVVVGSAITRPQEITKRFVKEIENLSLSK